MQIIAKIRKTPKTTPTVRVLHKTEGGVFGGTILESLKEDSLEEESLEEGSDTTVERKYVL